MANDLQKPAKMRRQPKQVRSQERVQSILGVAEQLFIESGYDQTTTRAIATRAEVPIGSLYQFFPDKEAILKALANHYFEQEYHLFVKLHTELAEAPIAVYVDRMVDAFDQFATDHPGYRAVLEQLIDLMVVADINTLDTYDPQIIKELAHFLEQRNSSLDSAKCELIATTIVKAVNELLWLSFTRDQIFREQLLAETKTLITAYLQTYQI
ncbi:TetR/AcrR family transcriptional regulator [Komarekiella sp. 'clone 1']|uniref:TetR/AcrR family transcriptional regulator n=1 Tax=Komarekiella delphini-convector SJRDD-AB1 TaxID=2593771 RepID=A0AA40VQS3_9NOST|nr:TetR/AcrR family transcriptional regulator [Komarekiella delphini-convector]MBD6616275.1 TetR/AcrR family transcriptional regulator [Komarekiella delphini-convector SJRDD-AB1]